MFQTVPTPSPKTRNRRRATLIKKSYENRDGPFAMGFLSDREAISVHAVDPSALGSVSIALIFADSPHRSSRHAGFMRRFTPRAQTTFALRSRKREQTLALVFFGGDLQLGEVRNNIVPIINLSLLFCKLIESINCIGTNWYLLKLFPTGNVF